MARFFKSDFNERDAVDIINKHAHPLHGYDDISPLLDRIGDARIVMLGEASHGTHEYYTWRSQISKRLIEEKGFSFIAVEGDWPDCYNINCYVKGEDKVHNGVAEVLRKFDRWPTWMWANWEVAALAEWLHNYNVSTGKRIGFYGLDVYSLWESLEAIHDYLEKEAPDALQKARQTFNCFEPYRGDESSYAYASRLVPERCENQVLELLLEIQTRFPQYRSADEGVLAQSKMR